MVVGVLLTLFLGGMNFIVVVSVIVWVWLFGVVGIVVSFLVKSFRNRHT